MTPFEQMKLNHMRRTFPMIGHWQMQKMLKLGEGALMFPFKFFRAMFQKDR